MKNIFKTTAIFWLAVIAVSFALNSCSENVDPPPPPPVPKPDTLSAGWSKLSVGTGSINDVVFYNSSNGLSVTSAGVIYRSADGGQTWQQVHTSTKDLVNISMSSSTHAILVGWNGKVLVTRNGGISFDSVVIDDPLLTDVFCLTASKAFAVGRYCWNTNDGGATWSRGPAFSSACTSVNFIDNLNGWIGCTGGLFKTTDGGVSWQPVPVVPVTGQLFHTVQFLNLNTGFIITNHSLGKTADNGATWSILHNLETTTYHDLHFIDSNNGYLTDGRYLLRTTDGGSTWNIVLRLGEAHLWEIHFTDLNHGWVGSTDGKIYRFL